MADALQYLHRQHPPIIHRDLKPDNILGLKNPKGGLIWWKIADFGIARVLKKNAYAEYYCATQIGTPIYMSPEALTVGERHFRGKYKSSTYGYHFRRKSIPLQLICGHWVQSYPSTATRYTSSQVSPPSLNGRGERAQSTVANTASTSGSSSPTSCALMQAIGLQLRKCWQKPTRTTDRDMTWQRIERNYKTYVSI